MADETTVKPEELQATSLKGFIDDHQKMISVIGVFIALGLLWKTIEGKESVPYISYLCFIITIPILFEIRRACNVKTASTTLRIFIDTLTGILLFTGIELLTTFPERTLRTVILTTLWLFTFPLLKLIETYTQEIKDRKLKRALELQSRLDEANTPKAERDPQIIQVNKELSRTRTLADILGLVLVIAVFLVLIGVQILITNCPAPVCYPNWKARVFVKFGPGLISSSLEKLAFRENSNGVK